MAQTTRLALFGPFSLFVGLRRPSLAAVGLCGLSWISCTFRKNTLKKKNLPMAQTTHLASFGPFSLFVSLRRPSLAAVGLRGLLWISCTFRKNILKKKTYLWPNDVSGVVWALFPLCGPTSAFVGCWGLRGLSWLSSTPKRGVVGVVQLAGNIKNKK